MISSIKDLIYELPSKFLNGSRLMVLGNKEIWVNLKTTRGHDLVFSLPCINKPLVLVLKKCTEADIKVWQYFLTLFDFSPIFPSLQTYILTFFVTSKYFLILSDLMVCISSIRHDGFRLKIDFRKFSSFVGGEV